jgi:hypothetical protein
MNSFEEQIYGERKVSSPINYEEIIANQIIRKFDDKCSCTFKTTI